MTSLLGSTESHIRLTNGRLEGTLTRLNTTNGLLVGTNGKLDGMGKDLHLTVGKLAVTNAQLRSTNQTLQRMEANIEAMTRKITHAKLLF